MQFNHPGKPEGQKEHKHHSRRNLQDSFSHPIYVLDHFSWLFKDKGMDLEKKYDHNLDKFIGCSHKFLESVYGRKSEPEFLDKDKAIVSDLQSLQKADCQRMIYYGNKD